MSKKIILAFLYQKHLGCLILLMGLMMASTMAIAKDFAPMPQFWPNEQSCSEYKIKTSTRQDADTATNQNYLQFFPAGKGIRRDYSGEVEVFKYRVVKKNRIEISLLYGGSDVYILSPSGELTEELGGKMVLASPNPVSACWTKEMPPIPTWVEQETFDYDTNINACKQGQTDIDACVFAASVSGTKEDAIAIYERGCNVSQSPYACRSWVEAVTTAAKEVNSTGDTQTAVASHETQVDQEKAILKALADSFAKAFTQTPSKQWVISDTLRHQWEKSCETLVSWMLCQDIARALWVNYPTQSIKILQSACQRGLTMSKKCEVYTKLVSDPQFMQATFQPVTQLPCGKVSLLDSSMGITDAYIFSDGGKVSYDDGSSNKMQARLVDGDIHFRHDQGGDFVLRSFGSWLVGADMWSTLQIYTSATQGACTPPIVYQETAIQVNTDYAFLSPLELKQKCDSHDAYACIVLGNQLILKGQLTEAIDPYGLGCKLNARESCENLLTVYQHMLEANIERRPVNKKSKTLLFNTKLPYHALKAACQPKPDQVACHVLELNPSIQPE